MFNLLFTAEEIIKYDKDMTTERDRANQLEYAMQQGLQQGELLGEGKKAKSMAIIMLRKGMSLTDIAEISGVNFFKDFKASVRNFIGGHSGSYEKELIDARSQAMDEMANRARALGADAVIGIGIDIDIDYEVLGTDNGMLMITASGTAVKLG